MDKKSLIITAVCVNTAMVALLLISSIAKKSEPLLPSSPALVETMSKGEKPVYNAVESEGFIALAAPKEEKREKPIKEKKIEESNVENIVHKLPQPEKVAKESKPLFIKEEKRKTDLFEVIVKKGDSLEKIAKIHQTSVAELKKANSLTSNFLREGQTLRVPLLANKKPSSLQGSESYYMVQRGDNPWTIAMKHHLKVEELLKLNNLDQEKAKKLRPGDRLRIR